MRQKIRKQLSLVEPQISHEHAAELKELGDIIERNPGIGELIYGDLILGLRDAQTGREGLMSGDQVFRTLLIKQMNGFSYAELAFHLADSRTYRSFCGFGFYDESPSESTLQRDVKKIRQETLEEINRIIVKEAFEHQIEKGKIIRVDCTVMESHIHDPTDASLLFDCVRVLCRLTQQAKEIFNVSATDHTRRAKRRRLGILNAKNETRRTALYQDLLKVTAKTVSDAKRIIEELRTKGDNALKAATISTELNQYLPLVEKVMDQTRRRVLNGEKVPANEKVVSIFEPHTDIIVKDRRDTFFGHKLTLAGGASGLITDLVVEQGNPADSTLAKVMIERQKDIYGQVPFKAAFDGGFASKENLYDIKALGVKDVAFSKKRGLNVKDMTKSEWVFKRLRDFRAGIEGTISYLKRSFGMRRCNWRGLASFQAYAWSSVITANLLMLARHLIE